jgi:hypothetical protein
MKRRSETDDDGPRLMTAEPRTGYSAPPPERQQARTGFSGYAENAPSGLQYAAPPPGPAPQPFPGYAGSAPSGPTYAEPVQPPDHAPAPQAAYPDPSLSLWPDELPGYLKPYPPPGGFSGRGPAVAPVVIFTLLFGVFGLISASRRAKRAEAVGDSPGRYWMAFGVTLSIGWVVGAIASILLLVSGDFFAVVAASADEAAPARTITAAGLSRSMADQGTYPGKGGKQSDIKAATCTIASVDPTGAGNYKCAVTLADTTRATVLVHAGTAGWRILGQAK